MLLFSLDYPGEEYESDAKLYGACDFFTKPLNVNLFMGTLNRMNRRSIT